MNIGNKTVTAGNGGTAIMGDGNVVSIIHPQLGINRSFIFDVCCKITNADIPYMDDYPIKSNANWINKYDYNNVSIYREIFDGDSYAYDDVEEILNEFPRRELLIKKIHTIYLEKEKIRSKKNEDGDYVLGLIYDEINNIIDKCEKPEQNILALEERERSIYLLMFYAFTKCRILKKPPLNNTKG